MDKNLPLKNTLFSAVMFYRMMDMFNKPAFFILFFMVIFSSVSFCESQEERQFMSLPSCGDLQEAESADSNPLLKVHDVEAKQHQALSD